MQQDSVSGEVLSEPSRPPLPPGRRTDLRRRGERPTRAALLQSLLGVLPPTAAVIATTGKCGRELFTLSDREQHLYMVGAMGAASGLGLGVALTAPGRPVVVVDGDGAALMKLGTMATIGARQPRRLLHVLLDNGVHDSTGGQATASASVDFAAVALACGYRAAWSVDDRDGFEQAVAGGLEATGPSLIHARMAPGSMSVLGRPTVPPHAVARRFRAFLSAD